MNSIIAALEAAKAALTAPTRGALPPEGNTIPTDSNPYARELAMIERAMMDMVLIDRGLRQLLAEQGMVSTPAPPQGDSVTPNDPEAV
jgi:hypothetical protein